MPEDNLYKLAKRLNITIQKTTVGGWITSYNGYLKTQNIIAAFVFTKNVGRGKKK